jgi:uncharacterized protein YhaN
MLRLAYVDIIFGDNKPVLIFDDPFVNLDDDRLQANLDLMRRVSEKYQVIYFTCRRNDYGR